MEDPLPMEFRVAQNEALSFVKSLDAVDAARYKRYVEKFDGRDPNKNGWLIVALGHLAYQLGLRLEVAEGKPLEDILKELSEEVGKRATDQADSDED